MNWYIGQEIVCVKTHSQRKVVRGRTYAIRSLKQNDCKCYGVLIDVGINGTASTVECPRCGKNSDDCDTIYWLGEPLFAPLDQDISELTEILEKENVVKI